MWFLIRQAWLDLASLGRDASLARRFLYGTGLLLLGSGAFHVLVLFWSGGGWEGPLSWRKPILFGFSGGVTNLSIAWVVGLVVAGAPPFPGRRLERWFCVIFGVAMLSEVGLISLQTWRGTASHFNEATLFDATVFSLTGLLISILVAQIGALTAVAFRPFGGPSDRRVAVRAGLLLLLLGCGLGYWALFQGLHQKQMGLPPEIYGKKGVIKFPHGLPIHAIQYLAIQSWLLRRLEVPERRRTTLILLSSVGLGLTVVFGLMQTLGGRARFDFTPISLGVFGFGVVLFFLPFTFAARAWLARFVPVRLR